MSESQSNAASAASSSDTAQVAAPSAAVASMGGKRVSKPVLLQICSACSASRCGGERRYCSGTCDLVIGCDVCGIVRVQRHCSHVLSVSFVRTCATSCVSGLLKLKVEKKTCGRERA